MLMNSSAPKRCSHPLLQPQAVPDRPYDVKSLRDWLAERGTEPAIQPNPTRKHPHPYDRGTCLGRNLIERMFCRLKVFCIATRYHKRADTFMCAVGLVAAIQWWWAN